MEREKMTPEEVIRTLEVAKAEVEWNYPMDYAVAIDEAIKAVDKQIPKKPIGDLHSVPHYRCPTCKCTVSMYNTQYDSFCKYCGQAIDWIEAWNRRVE